MALPDCLYDDNESFPEEAPGFHPVRLTHQHEKRRIRFSGARQSEGIVPNDFHVEDEPSKSDHSPENSNAVGQRNGGSSRMERKQSEDATFPSFGVIEGFHEEARRGEL